MIGAGCGSKTTPCRHGNGGKIKGVAMQNNKRDKSKALLELLAVPEDDEPITNEDVKKFIARLAKAFSKGNISWRKE